MLMKYYDKSHLYYGFKTNTQSLNTIIYTPVFNFREAILIKRLNIQYRYIFTLNKIKK